MASGVPLLLLLLLCLAALTTDSIATLVRLPKSLVTAAAAKQAAASTLVLDTFGAKNPHTQEYYREDSFLEVSGGGRRKLRIGKIPRKRVGRRRYTAYFRELRASESSWDGSKQTFVLKSAYGGLSVSCASTVQPMIKRVAGNGGPSGTLYVAPSESKRECRRPELFKLPFLPSRVLLWKAWRRLTGTAPVEAGRASLQQTPLEPTTWISCSGSHPYHGSISNAKIVVYWTTKLKAVGGSFEVINEPKHVAFPFSIHLSSGKMDRIKNEFRGQIRSKVKAEVKRMLKRVYSSKSAQASMKRVINSFINGGGSPVMSGLVHQGQGLPVFVPEPVVDDIYEDGEEYVMSVRNDDAPVQE